MTKQPSPRQALYFTLLGIAVGLLLAGLVVPLGFGTRAVDQFTALDSGLPEDPADEIPGRADSPDGEPLADPRETGDAPEDGEPGPAGTAAPREDAPSGRQDTASPAAPREGPATAQEPPGGHATAGQGVTSDTIHLGITIFDMGTASSLWVSVPGVDPEEQREWWEAWVADLNQRGGIHGRELVHSYYHYDILDPDSQRAACLEATQDDEVLAVLDIGNITHGAVLCFTEEGGLPFLSQGSQGFTDRDFQRSAGLLFSLFPEARRTLSNLVWELHQIGELREEVALGQEQPRTIGLLSKEGPGVRATIERAVVGTLEAAGYELTHWAELSQDASAAAAQIPVAVNQMRSRSVDAVLLLPGLLEATQFVQQAEAQRYLPSYYLTDWMGMWTQVAMAGMPRSFDGTLITTSRTGEWEAGHPETPKAATCRRVFREQTGKDQDPDEGGDTRWSRLQTCQLFRLFERGAEAAGPDLTRARLTAALSSLGEIPMAMFGGGSLTQGKFGVADLVRTTRYDPGCGCWVPEDDFRQPRF